MADPMELNVAADYLEEGGFDRAAKIIRGQTEAELWDSYVRAALCGAAVINSSLPKHVDDVANYATNVAHRILAARKSKYPNG
jgi:hypothetical protein